MLEKIRTLNPDYQIHELDDSFNEYGRIIKQDMQEAIAYASTYQNINAYDTSVQALEEMPCMPWVTFCPSMITLAPITASPLASTTVPLRIPVC